MRRNHGSCEGLDRRREREDGGGGDMTDTGDGHQPAHCLVVLCARRDLEVEHRYLLIEFGQDVDHELGRLPTGPIFQSEDQMPKLSSISQLIPFRKECSSMFAPS